MISVAKILTKRRVVAAVGACLAVAAIALVMHNWRFLNENAGGVTALATVVLVGVTMVYVALAHRQLGFMKRQAEEISRIRAMAVVWELMNAEACANNSPHEPVALCDAAYAMATTYFVGMCGRVDTCTMVLAAYAKIRASNAACNSLATPSNVKTKSWDECRAALVNAVTHIRDDPKLLDALGPFMAGQSREVLDLEEEASQ